MMFSQPKSLNPMQSINRYRFLTLINAGNICNEYQFTKQATSLWLANYPGDLLVKFHQAIAFANLGTKQIAVEELERLIEADPMFPEPYSALSQLSTDADKRNQYLFISQFLDGKTQPNKNGSAWLNTLWEARTKFLADEYEEAILLLHETLVNNQPTPIPAIFHLQAVHKIGNQDMLHNLSDIYHQQWPKCLQINVVKSLVEIDIGLDASAVERLHWVVAHDSSGQVIQQLMGTNHRFKNLWPQHFEIYFDLAIPASITSHLGWNQLKTGAVIAPIFSQPVVPAPNKAVSPTAETQKIHVAPPPAPFESHSDFTFGNEGDPVLQTTAKEPKLKQEPETWASYEDFADIQKSFSLIAKRVKKPELERADNRFPVYVILSSKTQLEKAYGPNTTKVIDEHLQTLVSLIQTQPNWNAALFYPDDPDSFAKHNVKPVIGSDPWQIKLALADFDAALAKKGEMIGALLIVGGPEIVPFHHLPNPTYDDDLDVPSDNPYACIDENYFISQWPVGRLPGEKGSDTGLLLEQIRTITGQYQQRSKLSKSIFGNMTSIVNLAWQYFSNLSTAVYDSRNFGFSAEIWQRASREVYKAIGKTKDLNLSPPVNINNLSSRKNNYLQAGYFNLHGIKDGPYWYGQKDFNAVSNEPDYPIAIRPDMFDEKNPSPKLILTEACYGANVIDKNVEEAIALKCLDTGTKSFIGSTCIAYGSIAAPLVAADFLAETFWKKIKEGLPAGYAFMQAKLILAEEMIKSQGFLDGEDQKTLLSFVLYGDPLAQHDGLQTMPKHLFRFTSYPSVKTISDGDMIIYSNDNKIPKQVDKQIKRAVEKYLPGLENAQMRVNKSVSTPKIKNGKTSGADEKDIPERYVVTLKKSLENGSNLAHQHFARMTFDKKGKLVKFTTSR